MASDPEDLVASGYDTFYAAWGRSPTLRRIWREHVTGDDFPAAFDHISFLPLDALRTLGERLRLEPGDLLVDLACGAGGPGLWVAAETGAGLVGIDLSPVAVQRAAERAVTLDIDATFRRGTFDDTGLETASVDALMTVDALQYAPDKRRALNEMARVLRPGGRLGMVVFELDAERVTGLPVWGDPVGDYRPLLDASGFDLLAYDELPGWRRLVEDGFRAVLAEQGQLAAELGEPAAAAIAAEASITLDLTPYRGHVLAAAVRR